MRQEITGRRRRSMRILILEYNRSAHAKQNKSNYPTPLLQKRNFHDIERPYTENKPDIVLLIFEINTWIDSCTITDIIKCFLLTLLQTFTIII